MLAYQAAYRARSRGHHNRVEHIRELHLGGPTCIGRIADRPRLAVPTVASDHDAVGMSPQRLRGTGSGTSLEVVVDYRHILWPVHEEDAAARPVFELDQVAFEPEPARGHAEVVSAPVSFNLEDCDRPHVFCEPVSRHSQSLAAARVDAYCPPLAQIPVHPRRQAPTSGKTKPPPPPNHVSGNHGEHPIQQDSPRVARSGPKPVSF